MSVAHQPDHIWTYADLATLPEDGHRYEIIGGELIVSPAPILDHQRIVNRLNVRLAAFVWERELGEVYAAPTDVKLSPHNVVEPDILFIARQRAHIERRAAVEGAPDLVVEVLSSGSRRRDLIQKRASYALVGIPEYLLIDPGAQTVTVLTLAEGQYAAVPPDAAGNARSLVPPGFTIAPAILFAATPPPLA